MISLSRTVRLRNDDSIRARVFEIMLRAYLVCTFDPIASLVVCSKVAVERLLLLVRSGIGLCDPPCCHHLEAGVQARLQSIL